MKLSAKWGFGISIFTLIAISLFSGGVSTARAASPIGGSPLGVVCTTPTASYTKGINQAQWNAVASGGTGNYQYSFLSSGSAPQSYHAMDTLTQTYYASPNPVTVNGSQVVQAWVTVNDGANNVTVQCPSISYVAHPAAPIVEGVGPSQFGGDLSGIRAEPNYYPNVRVSWYCPGGPTATATAYGDWSGSKSVSGFQDVLPSITKNQLIYGIQCSGGVLSNGMPRGTSYNVAILDTTYASGVLRIGVGELGAGTIDCDWSSTGVTGQIRTGSSTTCKIPFVPPSGGPTPGFGFLSKTYFFQWSGDNGVSGSQSFNTSLDPISYQGQTMTQVVTPVYSTPGTYNINILVRSGSQSAWTTRTITVVSPPAPVVTLTPNPATITPGGSSNLTWSGTNSNSCTGTNFSTGGAVGGTVSTGPLTTSRTYVVTCTGAGGTGSATTTVTVSTTPALSAPNPTPTSGLACGGIVGFQWTAISGATGYRIYNNLNSLITSISGTSYTQTGLTPGNSYLYYVSAYNATTESTHSPITVTASAACARPTVSFTVLDPNASEPGIDTGSFRVTRTGSTTTALTVNYTITGTATNASDYVSIPTSITIPVGTTSATRVLTPIDDILIESSETAIFTITSNALYTVGTPGSATITITDNDIGIPSPTPMVGLACGGNIGFQWAAVSGATGYRIYDFSDVLITTTSGTSYTQSGLAPGTIYRYYVSAYKTGAESVHSPITVLSTSACTTSLVASCSANATSAAVGAPVIWTATVSGGTTPYTYVWSGTDTLTGTTNSVTKSYSTVGTKTASVSVNGTTAVPCSTTVTVGTASTFNYNLSRNGHITVTKPTTGSTTGSNVISTTLTSGTTQGVTKSVSGLPTGVTASFSQATCSPTCNATLTLTVQSTTAAGTYTITVTGVSTGISNKTTTFNLVVNAAPGNPAPTPTPGLACGGIVGFQWPAVSGATGYRVYDYTNTLLTTLNASTTSYTQSALTPGNSYGYYVSAYNTFGESAHSPVTVVASASCATIPNAPVISSVVSACGATPSTVISWGSVSGAASYKVYKNGSASPLVTGVTGTSYTDTSVSVGQTPSYTVKATNGAGDSANSGSVTSNAIQGTCSTPPPPPPPPPPPGVTFDCKVTTPPDVPTATYFVGQPITWEVKNVSPDSAALTFTWTGNAPLNNRTGRIVTVVYSSIGQKTGFATADGVSCSTQTINVVVNPDGGEI